LYHYAHRRQLLIRTGADGLAGAHGNRGEQSGVTLDGLLPKYEALNPKYETSTNCQNSNVQNSFEHIQMWFEILVISILNLFRI